MLERHAEVLVEVQSALDEGGIELRFQGELVQVSTQSAASPGYWCWATLMNSRHLRGHRAEVGVTGGDGERRQVAEVEVGEVLHRYRHDGVRFERLMPAPRLAVGVLDRLAASSARPVPASR